jgi:competence protein ComEA
MAILPDNQVNNQSDSHSRHGITRVERLVLLFCFIIALLYAGWHYYQGSQIKVQLGEDIPNEAGGIVVQVEGAVESPGIIFLPAGSKISDAVDAAGGFSSNADTSSVNLNETVTDGGRVVIPSLGNTNQNSAGSGSVGLIQHDPSPGSIESPFPNRTGNSESPSGKVNINNANTYELQTLPGIGEELASRIVEYRQSHTGFGRIEDIMLVDGIAEGKFEEIRDLITVGD